MVRPPPAVFSFSRQNSEYDTSYRGTTAYPHPTGGGSSDGGGLDAPRGSLATTSGDRGGSVAGISGGATPGPGGVESGVGGVGSGLWGGDELPPFPYGASGPPSLAYMLPPPELIGPTSRTCEVIKTYTKSVLNGGKRLILTYEQNGALLWNTLY